VLVYRRKDVSEGPEDIGNGHLGGVGGVLVVLVYVLDEAGEAGPGCLHLWPGGRVDARPQADAGREVAYDSHGTVLVISQQPHEGVRAGGHARVCTEPNHRRGLSDGLLDDEAVVEGEGAAPVLCDDGLDATRFEEGSEDAADCEPRDVGLIASQRPEGVGQAGGEVVSMQGEGRGGHVPQPP
jgi:hypothetical protein